MSAHGAGPRSCAPSSRTSGRGAGVLCEEPEPFDVERFVALEDVG